MLKAFYNTWWGNLHTMQALHNIVCSDWRTLRVAGKQNSLFLVGPVIKHFVVHVPSNSKIEQTMKNYLLYAGWHTICHSFKVHDPITCKSKVQVVLSLV